MKAHINLIKSWRILFTFSLIWLFSSPLFASNQAATPKIIMWYEGYYQDLIRLAIEKTPEEGPVYIHSVQYSTEFSRNNMTQERMLNHLEQGEKLHIMAMGVTQERIDRFIPIRIPLLRGTLGMRVFLIHKDHQAYFDEISHFDELKSGFIAGFGEQWADIDILRHNGIKVKGVAKTILLPEMLSRKRFDFFPLEVQAAYDPEFLHNSNIQVEKNLAFYYVYPRYFFISKNQAKLATRINRGLQLALEDGSFNQVFFKYNGPVLMKANLANRLVLKKLDNPNFPKTEPEPDISWLYESWQ